MNIIDIMTFPSLQGSLALTAVSLWPCVRGHPNAETAKPARGAAGRRN